MKITEALKARRSYYAINRELPVAIDRVMDMVKELTELVPDAFNMKSSRAAVVHGEKQDQLWNKIYDVFEGKVAREKIDSFRAGQRHHSLFLRQESSRIASETISALCG